MKLLAALTLGFVVGISTKAEAQSIILTQGFDTVTGANGDVYFADSPTSYNGITDGTSSGGISTGASFAGNSNLNGRIVSTITASYGTISAPQAGTYFLYENTNSAFSGGEEVWGSPSVTVTQNTNYTFSFYLANQDTISVATIQPMVNGTNLGTTISATGTNTWEKFTLTWNSGSSTAAVFQLNNTNQAGDGNDFGVDSILVTVPEPRQWAQLGLLLCIGLVMAQRAVGLAREKFIDNDGPSRRSQHH